MTDSHSHSGVRRVPSETERADPERRSADSDLEAETRLERETSRLSRNGSPTASKAPRAGTDAPSFNGNGHARNGTVAVVSKLEVGAPRLPGDPGWDLVLPARARSTRWGVGQRVKRAADVVAASGGLLVLLPLFAVVALLVKLTSRGPVFYRSNYVGYRGRTFVGYKFRSMVENADELKDSLAHLNHMKGPAFKIRRDPRVTPLGRILRKLSIDELPQLWNVVKGDMSLVGPRPPLPEEYEEFEPWQRAKLAVRPGITCYWQIQGRSEICDFARWARLDLKYIEDWSLWTDFKILLRTVPAVFRGNGAY